MITTPNLGLKVWNLTTDPYDSGQLADNWARVDEHDHASGRGKQIPTGGIEDGAVTAVKLAVGANVPPDASITAAKIATGAVTTAKIASEAWTAYTPTLTNVTQGNGLISGLYYKVGRQVAFRATLTLGGSTSVSGAIGIGLPFTAASGGAGSYYGYIADASPVATYPAFVNATSTTVATVYAVNASATYATATATSSTIPITFASGDIVFISGVFEAAS